MRAQQEYVDVSEERHVYITPATVINAAWGSQRYQGSCTHAEKQREKKWTIFGYFLEIRAHIAVIKKLYLINNT